MIYSVVPRELEAELLEPLTAHYADEPEVTVIVDRRKGERRSRRGDAPARPRLSSASCATAAAAEPAAISRRCTAKDR